MDVFWTTCGESRQWCSLENVDLSNVSEGGVYIIWHSGNPARTIYVGQGNIAERIQAHRSDRAILQYTAFGNLLVTWAVVGLQNRPSVERYLANQLQPLEGIYHPDVWPIQVNLPW